MPAAKPRRLVYTPLDELVPADRNARLHDLADLTAKMERFGYLDPVVLDERTGKMIGGHGRLEALQQGKAAGLPAPEGIEVSRGVWKVPVVRGWSSSDDFEADAANLALNPSPNDPGFDQAVLAEILGDLQSASALEGTGYDESALSALLASLEPPAPQPAPADDVEPEEAIPADPVTKRGDVWIIGDHRFMCGDCRKPADAARALDGRTIQLAFTSPPYADRRPYDKASGFKPVRPDEYVEWFEPVQAGVKAHLAEDGSWFVNIKAASNGLESELYVMDLLVLAHAREWGWLFVTEFCWERNGTPGIPTRRFKNQFEPIFQFATAEWKFRPDSVRHASSNVPIYDPDDNVIFEKRQGEAGDEWFGARSRGYSSTEGMADMQGSGPTLAPRSRPGSAYPGNRLPTLSGSHEAIGHAAAFPVGLPEFFVQAYTDAGDVVYDPFMGSGSTLIAAHRHQRPAVGLELSPGYVDAALARIERHTGIVPVLEATGQPHSFLEGAS